MGVATTVDEVVEVVTTASTTITMVDISTSSEREAISSEKEATSNGMVGSSKGMAGSSSGMVASSSVEATIIAVDSEEIEADVEVAVTEALTTGMVKVPDSPEADTIPGETGLVHYSYNN